MTTVRKCVAAVLAASVVGLSTPAYAGDLAQVVTADERQAPAGENTVISEGHVDLGLVLGENGPELLARDDSGPDPVWRHLDDVVFNTSDAARQTLPEGGDYSFVNDGGDVWVVPQTEVVGVPWLGWNTQSPTLQDTVDRGVTMSITGHQGPGEASLFLQNGGFEPPLILWSTREPDKAENGGQFWVDLNTHTHANWTFSEPGVHQVGVRVDAALRTGETVSTDAVLTFAVGDGTDAEAAQAAEWNPDEAENSGGSLWGWVAGGALGLAFLIFVVFFALRRRDPNA